MEDEKNSYELVENREAIDLAPAWEPQLWWLLVGVLIVALVVILFLYFTRKKRAFDPRKAECDAFNKATEAIRIMEPSGIRESAVGVSLVMRAYLAESLGEPALYQTHEEFVGRHDALGNLPDSARDATGQFFEELAAMKYGPEELGEVSHIDFKARGLELLERIHAA